MKKMLASALLALTLVGGVAVPANASDNPNPRGSTHDTVGKKFPKVRTIVRNPGQRPYVCVTRLYIVGPNRVHCFVPRNF